MKLAQLEAVAPLKQARTLKWALTLKQTLKRIIIVLVIEYVVVLTAQNLVV
jgi:hypothetical protein